MPGLRAWHRVCLQCGYETAALDVAIDQVDEHGAMDEVMRGQGLRALRQDNFKRILRIMAPHMPALAGVRCARLLDVGAGHGWFVQMAGQLYDARGIEPDAGARAKAAAAGVSLMPGLFPQCLEAGDQFEAITFNDSLEHMTEPHAILAAAHRHLVPGGLLVLNLPDTRGLLYRAARGLARLGWAEPLDRMWQVGLPSPHLHYFSADNLVRLANQCGFRLVHQQPLPSIQLRGLYARIAYARPNAPLSSALWWLALLPMLPLVRLGASDIRVLVLRRD